MIGRVVPELLRYGAPTTLLLVVCALAGRAVLAPWLRGLRLVDQLPYALAGGIAVVVIGSTWWAYTGNSIRPVSWLLVVLAIVGSLFVGLDLVRGEGLRPLLFAVAGVGLAVGISLLQYWPVFESGYLPESSTAFTNANNDIAIYVVQSDNVVHSGFDEFDRISGVAVGAWTKGDHTGTSTSYAVFADLLREPTWRVAMPVMLVSLAATVLLLVAIGTRIARVGRAIVLAIGLWAISAALAGTVQANYYLGQSVARLLLVAQVFAVVELFGSDRTRRVALPLVSLGLSTSAALLAYPAGQVTSLVVVGAVTAGLVAIRAVRGPGRGEWIRLARDLGLAGATVALGVLSVMPRWKMIVDTIRLYSKPGITGWPAKTLDPAILIGLKTDPSVSWSRAWWLIALVVVVLAISGAVATARRDPTTLGVVMTMLAVPAMLYVLFAARIGSSTYQTWKFVATVQPLTTLAVGLLTVLGVRAIAQSARRAIGSENVQRAARFAAPVPVLVAGLFALGVAQQTWREVTSSEAVFAGRHVRSDVIAAGRSEAVRRQPQLTITLSPYFETMVAPVVVDLHYVSWGTDTYRGPPGPQFACTLTTAAQVASGATVSDRVAGDVVLVATPQCAADNS